MCQVANNESRECFHIAAFQYHILLIFFMCFIT